MKVRAVLEVTRVQHTRVRGHAQTVVTMSGSGSEPLCLVWTIPEWCPITVGTTYEVDINAVRGGVGLERSDGTGLD